MPRGARKPSEVFKTILAQAQGEIIEASKKSAAFVHKGIRGDERAAALAKFLCEHLPSAFGVCKGEVIDFQDNRSGQLDLMLYHRQSCAPVSKQAENILLPCKASTL